MNMARQRKLLRQVIARGKPVEEVAWMLGVSEQRAVELIKRENALIREERAQESHKGEMLKLPGEKEEQGEKET